MYQTCKNMKGSRWKFNHNIQNPILFQNAWFDLKHQVSPMELYKNRVKSKLPTAAGGRLAVAGDINRR